MLPTSICGGNRGWYVLFSAVDRSRLGMGEEAG